MINFFDLGMNEGHVTDKMTAILDAARAEYSVYGFEPVQTHYDKLVMKYVGDPRFRIFRLAISNSNKPVKIHHCDNNEGHSIFASKGNVSQTSTETVPAVVFSEWLKGHVPEFQEVGQVNIMKVNIEGAEWHLFKDLVDSGVVHHIDQFCGSRGRDVEKIPELADRIKAYYSMLKENGISVPQFCCTPKDVDMKKLLQKKGII